MYYVQQLRDAVSKVKPVPFYHKNKFTVFVHPDLEKCKRVYLRVNRVRLPLEASYDGSFTVVFKAKKFFKIRFHDGKEDTVSIDKLKSAYEINYHEYGENDEHSSLHKTKALVGILKKCSCELEPDVTEVSKNEKRATS